MFEGVLGGQGNMGLSSSEGKAGERRPAWGQRGRDHGRGLGVSPALGQDSEAAVCSGYWIRTIQGTVKTLLGGVGRGAGKYQRSWQSGWGALVQS